MTQHKLAEQKHKVGRVKDCVARGQVGVHREGQVQLSVGQLVGQQGRRQVELRRACEQEGQVRISLAIGGQRQRCASDLSHEIDAGTFAANQALDHL